MGKVYFGHTDFFQVFGIDGDLIRGRDDFAVGQSVSYTDERGDKAGTGMITKLNKRTVRLKVDDKTNKVSYARLKWESVASSSC